jgi:Arc/MetJ-type ribon-helix-helix transcriptional regulator
MNKESGSKEVELHEDDPAAVFGLLRYIYDLPYYSGSSYDDDERWNSLVPHAELFVAAEKYQVLGLQCEICSRLHNRIENWLAEGEFPNVDDFIRALRKIVTQASDDNRLRRLMVRTCAANLSELQDVTEFLSLLKEFGSLGAESSDTRILSVGWWVLGCAQRNVPRTVHRCALLVASTSSLNVLGRVATKNCGGAVTATN